MPYKQQKPLSSSIKVEQPNEPSSHPIRRKKLNNYREQPGDIEGMVSLRQIQTGPTDNSHTMANVELDD
jgi:hypothetical protein